MSIASNAPVRVLLVGVIFWGNGVDDLAYLKEFENSDWSAAFSVRKMKIMPYKMYHEQCYYPAAIQLQLH
eukprot:812665-Pelagomonas_calceolata.AAC.3